LVNALAEIQEFKASVFFFEKKNQKTFASCSCGIEAEHGKHISLAAGKARSALLQKRRPFFFIRAGSFTQFV
jgi:hypothetical protein